MRGVRKAFGAVRALDGVDLEVRAGEVHALVGENGAGKSTLMKVLSGAHAPDDGTMELFGCPFAPAGPLDARAAGVAMIYQELNLAPHLTVAENVLLGREERGPLGVIDRARGAARVEGALRAIDHADLRADDRVQDLSPGARQMVEVARALAFDARVVVMDEPTSSLGKRDVERLFEAIRRLTERGVAVVYISHFLDEVGRVGDRYTVLRDGKSVATGDLADVGHDALIEAMVGRTIDEVFPRVPRSPGEVVLRVERLAGRKLPVDASFELRRGEILGIAGLVGAGRTEMLRAIFGLDAARGGAVVGRERTGLLSENRKEEGLLLSRPIAVNVTLSKLDPFTTLGVVDARRQEAATAGWIDRLGIRCVGPRQAAGALSGGNQQKVALARLLHHDVDVLLLDEPTRGVDVASKAEIYRRMGELAAAGKGIVFVSSSLPELLGVCDRVAVMHRGRLGTPRPAEEWTETALLEEATTGGT
ncbi:MAG: sugar ABC transporter ATP-binding protein [Planctomycetota bacterium JB042]